MVRTAIAMLAMAVANFITTIAMLAATVGTVASCLRCIELLFEDIADYHDRDW